MEKHIKNYKAILKFNLTSVSVNVIFYLVSHHSCSISGLIGRAMPHDRDSPHHTPYKDAHHIRGSISQGARPDYIYIS